MNQSGRARLRTAVLLVVTSCIIAIVMSKLINQHVAFPVLTTGTSMTPSIQPDTHLWIIRYSSINKFLIGATKPEVGDVVALRSSDNSPISIKRILALPGDTVRMNRDRITVSNVNQTLIDNFMPDGLDVNPVWKNSIALPLRGSSMSTNSEEWYNIESVVSDYEDIKVEYISGQTFIDSNKCNMYKFKNDYYAVIGDNLPMSTDSRVQGMIPHRYIIGFVK